MTAFTILNLPFPIVAQHSPQSSTVENNLCGEAVTASQVGYVLGVALMPTLQQIVSAILAGGKPTSAAELDGYLKSRGIATTDTVPTSQDNLTWQTWSALKVGKVLRILQQFSDAVTEKHWRGVIGMTESYIVLHEPWNGSLVRQDYATYWRLHLAAGTERVLTSIDTLPKVTP